MEKLFSVVGILSILLLVWIFSSDKKNFPFRIVLWGLAIQFALAFFVLKFPLGVQIFSWLGDAVSGFLNNSMKSAEFLFGNAIKPEFFGTFGFQFAIIVASTVIFFSAFVSILYHFGVMQKIVYGMAWFMHKTMGTSGTESLSASANIFLGQTEAPLLIRHYLNSATLSELNSIMTVGFATIAGGVMAAYISMGVEAKYLISASIISAPGGLLLSKILMPPKDKGKSLEEIKNVDIPKSDNVLTAVSQGATDGVYLTLNILGMLIAFIAIIAVFDSGLAILDNWLTTSFGINFLPSSLKEFLGYVFQPYAYMVGLTGDDAKTFGS
jgi:CNT family concentrative nucleoside transporter